MVEGSRLAHLVEIEMQGAKDLDNKSTGIKISMMKEQIIS